MQSAIFVFVGLRENKTEHDVSILLETLQQASYDKGLCVNFTRKDELLSATFENVSYYVSLIGDKTEVKDWVQMAKDFELEGNKKPINEAVFVERNNRKKMKNPSLYQEQHYTIGRLIFDCLNSFKDIEILFYQ